MTEVFEPPKYSFGKGNAGKSARLIIEKYKEPCEKCLGPAEYTLDFDWRGELTQFAVCSGCEPEIVARVIHDLQAIGQIDTVNTFSHNGLGRS